MVTGFKDAIHPMIIFINENITNSLSPKELRLCQYRQLDILGIGLNKKTYKEIAAIEGFTLERGRQITHRIRRKVERKFRIISNKMNGAHVIVKYVEKPPETDEERNQIIRQKFFWELGADVSVRIRNILCVAGLERIEDLLNQSTVDLLRLPNMGEKSVKEMIVILNSHGLTLRKE